MLVFSACVSLRDNPYRPRAGLPSPAPQPTTRSRNRLLQRDSFRAPQDDIRRTARAQAGQFYVLFTKVNTPRRLRHRRQSGTSDGTSRNVRRISQLYQQGKEVKLLPLYTEDAGGYVLSAVTRGRARRSIGTPPGHRSPRPRPKQFRPRRRRLRLLQGRITLLLSIRATCHASDSITFTCTGRAIVCAVWYVKHLMQRRGKEL